MFQIMTGRFFEPGPRHHHLDKTELFSLAKVDATITLTFADGSNFSLTLADDDDGIYRYDFEFPIGLPGTGTEIGTMYGISGHFVAEQFIAALQIFSGVIWSTNRDYLKRQANKPRHSFEGLLGKGRVISGSDIAFKMRRLLFLPRKKYSLLISAGVECSRAIQAIEHSYDAGFSMIIFTLESLVPKHGDAKWDDYPQRERLKIEKVAGESPELLNQIKNILISGGHFKLEAKFLEFIDKMTHSSFYRSEHGVRRSVLPQALRNAYNGRSRYVHTLEPVQRPAWAASRSMFFGPDWKPHLTFEGSVRLTFHILQNCIDSGPHLAQEKSVNWGTDVMRLHTKKVRAAYEYWLWKPEVFDTDSFSAHIYDFFTNISDVLARRSKALNLGPGLSIALKRVAQLKKAERIRVLSMIHTWNSITSPHLRVTVPKKCTDRTVI